MTTETAFPELTPDEAAELIFRSEAMVYDLSPRPRWSSGHLPGAINLDADKFTVSDLPQDKNTRLIFYCSASGNASRFAARKALRFGYRHIFLMPSGLKGWMVAGHRARSA